MRKIVPVALASVGLLVLAGCGGGSKGALGHAGPDEFAVARRAPLVIPPDFALTPPRPGAPRPQEADSSTQALQAMFGGQAQVSASEAALLGQAGAASADPAVRSTASDPKATVVDKGAKTRERLAAPEGSSPEASATVKK